MFVLVSLYSSC